MKLLDINSKIIVRYVFISVKLTVLVDDEVDPEKPQIRQTSRTLCLHCSCWPNINDAAILMRVYKRKATKHLKYQQFIILRIYHVFEK
jgi:hypothetical protein